ncbi:hypothetical protein GCM10027051_15190 [Niabella terrae]
MLTIQILLVLLALAGVLYFHRKSLKAGGGVAQELEKARRSVEASRSDSAALQQEVFTVIDGAFSETFAADIRQGIISKGMPSVFLTLAWGPPDTVTQEDNGLEIWTYQARKAVSSGTAVTIRNKQVLKLIDL